MTQLMLQRYQQTGRNRTYCLTVELHCTPDELTLIDEHRLGSHALYAVPEQQHDHDRAVDAFARSDTRSLFRGSDARRLLGDLIVGLFHLTRSQLRYSVTVADAVDGTTIYCSDLMELLECERLITASFDQFDRLLDDAHAFTVEREQILDPDGAPDDAGTPPHQWANPYQHLR